MSNQLPVIVVHGGAPSQSETDDTTEGKLLCVKEAAKIGYRMLLEGENCLDAAVAVVSALEDDPALNCGKGSSLNSERSVEMHSMVMRGDTLECGGVIALQYVKNPVQVSKLVMKKTKHCLLDARSGLALARKHNIPIMPMEYFITDKTKQKLEKFMIDEKRGDAVFGREIDHDTVGVLTLDKVGNLACATSTGGISGQMPGRVSDAAIPGSGGYADNNSLAVCSTGHGESLLRVSVARLVSLHAEQGFSPQESVDKALKRLKFRTGGFGGAIALDKLGRIGIGFATDRIPWTAMGGQLELTTNNDQNRIASGILLGDIRIDYFNNL